MPPTSTGTALAPTATAVPATNTPAAQTATATPSATGTSTGALLSDNFDGQGTGALVTGSSSQFTGASGAANLSVENAVAASPPNALAISVNGGGSYYAYKQYSSGYTNLDLKFSLQLGSDFTLPSSEYLVLAQTTPSSSANPGKVNITLPGDGRIRLDYFDSAGTQHSLYGTLVLTTGGWHTVELRETLGAGSGSLALLLDGSTVASGSSLDTGSQGATWFAVGDKYTPSDTGTAGHLYVDDVVLVDPPSTPNATATTVPPTNTSTPVPPTSTSTPVAPTATATTTAAHLQTVFVIMMENTSFSDIQGNSSSAPYLNSLLTGANNSQTSYATQYYTPPGNHPSLPNYLWLEGGQCYSYCGTDNSPSSSPNGISATQHLATLLNSAGISWRAYQEGISDGTCPLSDSYPYAAKHNPFVYFNDVNGSSAYCTAHERSFADLGTDLANNTVARYNYITPDLCDDMHDSCAPTNDAIKQGDTWLSNAVPPILNSPAYKNGGALFIIWDEGTNDSDGPIGNIVLSPYAKGHGYANAISYTHSSTLRSLEEIFGVSPLLGDAANATDLRDLFTAFP